jgi:hypothetical protein
MTRQQPGRVSQTRATISGFNPPVLSAGGRGERAASQYYFQLSRAQDRTRVRCKWATFQSNVDVYRAGRISQRLRLYRSAVGSLSLMVTTVPLARVAEVCCCTQNVSPIVAKYW